jgi:hypothetical protein
MTGTETFNPWSVVNVVFHHLVDAGLHPVLGETGDPSEPAAALLSALGVEPVRPTEAHYLADVSNAEKLAALRAALLEEEEGGVRGEGTFRDSR